MEKTKVEIVALVLLAVISSASAQVTTSCTSALISSFTPCFNFITGSTNGSGSPTSECCQSLSSLISSSTDCACLILTANVPFSIPINRSLAIALPRRCNSNSVPLQCTGSATPVPSAGSPLGLPVPSGFGLPPFPSTPASTSEPPPPAETTAPAPSPADASDQRPLLQLPNSAEKLPLSKVFLLLVLAAIMA